MAKDYTLLMKKNTEGSSVKSSLDDFGFAVQPIEWPALEIKELAKRDWPGEHGEDVYFPASGTKLKSFEVNIIFISESSWYNDYNNFVDYLFGMGYKGIEMMIYDPYYQRGYKGVYAKKINKPELFGEDGISFDVTFSVIKPNLNIELIRN